MSREKKKQHQMLRRQCYGIRVVGQKQAINTTTLLVVAVLVLLLVEKNGVKNNQNTVVRSFVSGFVVRSTTTTSRSDTTNSLFNPNKNVHLSNTQGSLSLASLKKKTTTTRSLKTTAKTTTQLYGSNLKDYSDAAQALFGNLIGPASMLAGGLVPLGFLAPPLPDKTKRERKLKCMFMVLSVFSLASDLISIIYATVACNKLTETPAVMAESAFALIKKEYEISWLGTNLHFMMALCGMLGMVMIRALSMFPNPLKGPSAGIAGSVILLSLSIINRGVTVGDGRGHRFGGSLLTLLGRYFYLLVKKIPQRGPMEISALFMASISFLFCIKALLMDEPPTKEDAEG